MVGDCVVVVSELGADDGGWVDSTIELGGLEGTTEEGGGSDDGGAAEEGGGADEGGGAEEGGSADEVGGASDDGDEA